MSEKSADGQADAFDLERIRGLVALMREFDLQEIDLRHPPQRIRLRRRTESGVEVVAPRELAKSPPVQSAAPEKAPATAPTGEENVVEVKSPMVGTFYLSPNPESPPFVKVGDHVGPESVVCIIEAMKVFNEIPAEVSGKILSVLAKNGDPVEFGQALFRVSKA